MSRGPGRVQRAILTALYTDTRQHPWWTITELTEHVHGKPLTRSGVESVRRAVKSLAAAGAVEIEYFDECVDIAAARIDLGQAYAYRGKHCANRPLLFVRPALSVEEKADQKQRRDALIDRLVAIDARIPS